MPPAFHQHHILMLDEAGIFALHEEFLGLFAAQESNFFREFGKTGMRVPQIAR